MRSRLILKSTLKSIKFWPVVSFLGPRQCGKSTFLRQLLFKRDSEFDWVSLDKKADRKLATNNPEVFLNRFKKSPLIIDEAHKSPDLFDEIKARVDENRQPGKYILSGSILFSKKIGIQESLTGRSSVIRMDTLTLEETTEKKVHTLSDLDVYLEKGGMPGACFIRNSEERTQYWDQWIETTCQRDIKNFSKGRLVGDLAEEILQLCCTLEEPGIAEIAKAVRVDSRRVKSHLEALEALFVIRKLGPSMSGIGKSWYLPFDSGLGNHLESSLRNRWRISFLTHYLNHSWFLSRKAKPARYYLTRRHSLIDFEINGNEFHLFCDKPVPGRTELMTVRAAKKANPNHSIFIHCATDAFEKVIHEDATLVGWAHGMTSIGKGEPVSRS